MKNILTIAFGLLMALCLAGAVAALPATIDQVSIDNVILQPSSQGTNRLSVLRGEALDVRVLLKATDDVQNAKLRVLITDTDDIEAETESFDIAVNSGETVTRAVTLPLDLPDDLDTGNYKLRVFLSDRNGEEIIQNYDLFIDTLRHETFIKELIVNPSTVMAGEDVSLSALIRNAGSRDEDDVKLEFSIPGISLSGKLFIDQLDADDDAQPDDPLTLKIPCSVKPDTYTVEATMTYDKGRRTDTASDSFTVTENPACSSTQTVVIVQQPAPPAAPAPAPQPAAQPPAPAPAPEPQVVLSPDVTKLRGILEIALLALVGVLVLVGVIVGFSRLGGSDE